jgi:hypothetical protein
MHLRVATVLARCLPVLIPRFKSVVTGHTPIRRTGIIGTIITGTIDIGICIENRLQARRSRRPECCLPLRAREVRPKLALAF